MEEFGPAFELDLFRDAYEGEDPKLYNRVQAVERAFVHIQNDIAKLAEEGAKLAGLTRRLHEGDEPRIAPYLEALRDAGVMDKQVCRRLTASHRMRARVEHVYDELTADQLHRSIRELSDLAPEFLSAYVPWVKPHLEGKP